MKIVIFRVSTTTEDKLFEMDNNLKELEVMVSLFENKLNSLPENVVAQYPALSSFNLGDFSSMNAPVVGQSANPPVQDANLNQNNTQVNTNPVVQNSNTNLPTIPEEAKEAEKQPEPEPTPETPYDKMMKLIEENSSLNGLHKVLKVGVPIEQVRQRSKVQAIDPDIVDQFLKLYKEVNPSAI